MQDPKNIPPSPEIPYTLVKQIQEAMWQSANQNTYAQIVVKYQEDKSVRLIILPDSVLPKVADENAN